MSPFPLAILIAENGGGGGGWAVCDAFALLVWVVSAWKKLTLGIVELWVGANVMGISVCTPLLDTCTTYEVDTAVGGWPGDGIIDCDGCGDWMKECTDQGADGTEKGSPVGGEVTSIGDAQPVCGGSDDGGTVCDRRCSELLGDAIDGGCSVSVK